MAIEPERWTGDVEAQRRELKRFAILLAVVVVLLTPVAVWFARIMSRLIIGL